MHTNCSVDFRFTFATFLTCLRLVLVPFIVYTIKQGMWKGAGILFLVAAITDFLDGIVARAFNQKTYLGAFLDPIADKILIIASFVALTVSKQVFLKIPYWFMILLLIRESIIIMGAGLLKWRNDRFVVTPTILGKMTMGAYSIGVGILLSEPIFQWHSVEWNEWIFLILSIFMISSLFHYIISGISSLKRVSL